jgi:signal transduction histidine kinase
VEVVSNALDAMPNGGTLRISARAVQETGEPGVVVEISDTGVGIPERVLESVCEPFFTTRTEGTGLGLAIAKRYIEQNGGALEISSIVGTGTTVRIRLAGIEGAESPESMMSESAATARAGARQS